MGILPAAAEPSDCWQLVGPDDAATPPTIACMLNAIGTRWEWRRAGLPVLFDDTGVVRHVLRAGREYRFVPVGEAPMLSARRAPAGSDHPAEAQFATRTVTGRSLPAAL